MLALGLFLGQRGSLWDLGVAFIIKMYKIKIKINNKNGKIETLSSTPSIALMVVLTLFIVLVSVTMYEFKFDALGWQLSPQQVYDGAEQFDGDVFIIRVLLFWSFKAVDKADGETPSPNSSDVFLIFLQQRLISSFTIVMSNCYRRLIREMIFLATSLVPWLFKCKPFLPKLERPTFEWSKDG